MRTGKNILIMFLAPHCKALGYKPARKSPRGAEVAPDERHAIYLKLAHDPIYQERALVNALPAPRCLCAAS